MKTLALVQARMSSTRLPGKVMKNLSGAPMLARQLERIGRAESLDRVEVATSIEAEDDVIAALCESLGIGCFRGALHDVLDRYYQAARRLTPAYVVRLTSDCPLADWEVIDATVRLHVESGYDYTSNTLTRTYQHGLDVEVMTFAALETAWREATQPDEREHVTPFLHHHPERFRLGGQVRWPSLAQHRWTVDYPDDFTFVHAVYQSLYLDKPDFTSEDVLSLLAAHPEIAALNARHA